MEDEDRRAVRLMSPGAKRRAELEARRGYVTRELPPQPEWEILEGSKVLRIPGAQEAAIPVTGRKDSRRFVVFDVGTREVLCPLWKDEVREWLIRKNEAA